MNPHVLQHKVQLLYEWACDNSTDIVDLKVGLYGWMKS